MTKKTQIFASVLSIFIIGLFAVGAVVLRVQTPTAEQNTSTNQPVELFLVPSETQVKIDETTKIDATFDSGQTQVESLNFNLTFDPDVLEFKSFTTALGTPIVNANSKTGTISFTLVLPNTVSGLQNLGTFEFSGRAAKIISLDFAIEPAPRVNNTLSPRTGGTTVEVQ